MREILLSVGLKSDVLIEAIVDNLSFDETLEFVLAIENEVADFDFTNTLIRRLHERAGYEEDDKSPRYIATKG